MSNIILLPASLALGSILRSTRRVPEDAHLSISAIIIHVALSALVGRMFGLSLSTIGALPGWWYLLKAA